MKREASAKWTSLQNAAQAAENSLLCMRDSRQDKRPL